MAKVRNTFSSRANGSAAPSDGQLRKDRITALIVLIVMAALMGLLFALASFGNGGPENLGHEWFMP